MNIKKNGVTLGTNVENSRKNVMIMMENGLMLRKELKKRNFIHENQEQLTNFRKICF